MTIEKITRNSARCSRCGQEIESKFTHDFVTCKCGALSVDGGLSYRRRLFESEVPYEETSIYEEVPWTTR